MNSIFFVAAVSGLLYTWDLQLKVLTAFRYSTARKYIKNNIWNWTRELFAVARLYGGLNVEIASDVPEEDVPQQCLLIANHQSLVDIAVLLFAFPHHSLRFVAKKELEHWYPAVSHVLRAQKHAMIDRRANYSSTMHRLGVFGRNSKSGYCPVVFPEGTRSRDGQVKTFSAGAVRRVLEYNPLPIVAVAVDGGYKVSHFTSLVRDTREKAYRARIMQIYPAPQTKQEVAATLKSAQQTITSQINSWQHMDA
ncbi:MAG: 1-acyl-sn-glycerol-3-phosphate acyltransferase [Spirochaeta sp.]|nr:1-acyl-sn-glycerol-3-phosphate acyltransferase [Spirochaeta sp.]